MSLWNSIVKHDKKKNGERNMAEEKLEQREQATLDGQTTPSEEQMNQDAYQNGGNISQEQQTAPSLPTEAQCDGSDASNQASNEGTNNDESNPEMDSPPNDQAETKNELTYIPPEAVAEFSELIRTTLREEMIPIDEHFTFYSNMTKTEITKTLQKSERKTFEQMIKLYEHFAKITKKFSADEEFKEKYGIVLRFEDMMLRSIKSLGIDVGSFQLGDSVFDKEYYCDIIVVEVVPEQDKWGKVSDLIDKYYYIYNGEVIHPQKLIIFNERDV